MNPGTAKRNKPAKDSGHTMKKLYRWMTALGLPYASFVNASSEFTDDPNPVITDEDREILEKSTEGYEVVIALGRTAAIALDRINRKHLRVPHPSGRNRVWNNDGAEAAVIKMMREYASNRKRTSLSGD